MKDRRAVFITGAASGIGLAAAKKFIREGWFVGLSDIDVLALRAARAGFDANACTSITLDVRDEAAWRAALESFVSQSGGRLDALVNNAGLAAYDWFDALPLADHLLQIDVNLKGVVLGAYIGLEYLRQTPGARLINVASQASMTAAPRLAVYSATKFAVRGLSEALDIEFMRLGVRCACIMPGLIDTPLLDKAHDAQGRSFREATAQAPLLDAALVGDAIFAATSGADMHYGVGAGAEQQAEPLRAAAAIMRARWATMIETAAKSGA